ncbi:FAD-binding oxidoreductase [Phanerochaete sordida]|uniref:FAD-binding oxidoreductase n=1 Tax=Phanerochaete sordida TaxID=48140 RepID=A0A9P3G777_9APHY|nr:FAD-binding oxidoreductase [Phanerochaete sordida]
MSDLEDLKRKFKGDIVTPSDAGYADAIARWATNAVRRARIVAYVRDAADVGAALRYARAHGLPLAVHGGGHSASGASSVAGGLVVDLARFLGGVRVDAQARRAYVGGGARWGAVDAACAAHGLAVVGATVSHTGVGGLTVAGGYGWLTPTHGLTIDSLVGATVVAADGVAHTASESENPGLLWGIRGGGCNLGVVTEFVFELRPQRRTVFCGEMIFTEEKLEAVAEAVEDWYPTAGENQVIHVTLGRGSDGNPTITLLMFYNGAEADGREAFKAFSDLGPVMDLRREMTYEMSNSFMDTSFPAGQCHWSKGVAAVDATRIMTRRVFDKIMELSAPGTPMDHVTLTIEYMSQAKVNSVPSAATAFVRNRPGLGNASVQVVWDADTPELTAAARHIADEIARAVQAGELRRGGRCAESEASPERADRFARARALFGANYPRMQRLKRRYDPEIIFDKWFVVEPSE